MSDVLRLEESRAEYAARQTIVDALEAEWHNGNLSESALERLHATVLAALRAISSEGAGDGLTEARLREALEDMVRQFGYWSEGVGGIGTGGLSTLEFAFEALGWDDPHPLPDRRCDEPGCMKDGTMGWPTRPGGTGPNGGYRRTCWDHSDIGKQRAAAALRDARSPEEG